MKLAFAIFRYFPFGGLQRDMLALAQAAVQHGHQVSIFCGDWQGEKISGIDVIEIKNSGFFNIAGVKNFVAAFQQQYQREQFDLLVGFNKMPGLDVYYSGDSCFAKKAYEERGGLYRLTPRAQLYIQYEAAVYSHLSKTHILEVSAAERPIFAKYYATPVERQTLLPPGVDPLLKLSAEQRVVARQKIRRELELANNEYLILCVGSGFKTKGLDRSIRSFAAFRKCNPKALLAVVGSGDSRPFLSLIASLDLANSVRFLGGRSDMADIYAAGDMLLHSAYKEVTGNVIVEAMLCALPVLTTPVCGYAHYVLDFAMGELLQAPDDARLVATQMEKLLKVDASYWTAKAKLFAIASDISSRPKCAVKELERLACISSVGPLVQSAAGQYVILRDELIDSWKGQDVFSLMENMQGEIAREMKDRQTLRFEINGQGYYRKWHRGVGWQEIIKNCLQLRWPVLGASNEWNALNKLRALSIPSLIPLAYGVRGKNPARQQSFIVTRELTDVIQLDHFFEQYSVDVKAKHRILASLATIARELHAAGINHRDFYLCHFMLKTQFIANQHQAPEIYVVDLHRAQLRPQVPERWLVKDLGSLLFSSLNLQFTRRDYLRFLQVYFAQDARVVLVEQKVLLTKIAARARATYRRDFGHEPLLPSHLLSGQRN